jgi:hypothetical protein
MKTNIKALQLIEKGLSSNTVSKLTESQINTLHSKLFVNLLSEQSKATTSVSSKNPNAPTLAKNLNAQGVNVTMTEKEIDEEEEVTVDPNKDTETQDPHQVGPSSNDGFGNYSDGDMTEEKKGPNPWAICHTQVGPKKSRKWERCVREIKKQLKEGKNPVSLFLENQITKIVEKHMPPKITKGDLIKHITESGSNFATKHLQTGFGTEVAPSKPKPKVEPGTKETPKTRPNPFKNPNPNVHPAPKAKKSENNEQQPEPITKPAPTKPITKPTPKTRPNPFKNPNPGVHPAPKAKKVSPEQAKDTVIDVIMKMLEK